MARVLVFVVWAALVSCTSSPSVLNSASEYPEEFGTAVHLVQMKEYDKAEAHMKNYLQQTRDIRWHGSALLLLGDIYKEKGDVDQAITTYKQVVEHGAGFHTAHVARALYQLSWQYEKLQKYEDLVYVLTDLPKHLKTGDDFVRLVETPARLANAYYTMNLWDKAMSFREQSLKAIADGGANNVPDETASRVYFYLSFVQLIAPHDMDRRYPTVVSMAQKDLLRLIERKSHDISEKAAWDLWNLYQSYYKFISERPMPKNAVEKRERNTAMLAELARFIDVVEELKVARSPENIIVNKERSANFIARIAKLESDARALAHALEIGVQPEPKKPRTRR